MRECNFGASFRAEALLKMGQGFFKFFFRVFKFFLIFLLFFFNFFFFLGISRAINKNGGLGTLRQRKGAQEQETELCDV
jgi:hypothetical protein